MRFLEGNNDGEFSLTKDFVGDNIPKYAILSHTWGEDIEEVTFEDLKNGTGKSKAGYKKIQFCGEQAGRDGIRYFWVDTCCINKSNNTELARAINSMFRWYRNANKCYVYLSDVLGSMSNINNSHQLPWELAFRASRWFTRGWTLQELLAPASVEFFSREGECLGDKKTLERQIHQITNIPITALRGTPLSQFNVEERLLWAETRQTTHGEDKAYSMLGIFDVYMPLIYGEGREHAFKRLRKEIQDSLIENGHLIDAQSRSCIQDLRIKDPREDKKRIEQTKGGLLEDSYRWIIDHVDFLRWRHDKQTRLLWIKGDPGKGKTMLLCGITNELRKSVGKSDLLAFFFCQATDSRINSATAVLRGLIYLLADQQPSLLTHIQKKYNHTGKQLFDGTNAWVALSEILTNILEDQILQNTYLVIDALDECVTGLPLLLDFIIRKLSVCSRVKLIVSSRNRPSIEEHLNTATQKARLCLELNEDSVFDAVNKYIRFKVDELVHLKKYKDETRDAIHDHLSSNAHGTFLWVALVCQDLKEVPKWKVLGRLKAFPPGLDSLYQQMMDQIHYSDDAELYKQIIAIMSTVFRPITLVELTSFVPALKDLSNDYESLGEIIRHCGSFLTLRGHTLYFTHQSAKDYLLGRACNKLFPLNIAEVNYVIFSRSHEIMSRTLRRNIYEIETPGFPIDSVKPPDPDPLNIIGYSCIYWVDHLCASQNTICLSNNSIVHIFLKEHFLHWIEALSLLKSVINGILAIHKLENFLISIKSPSLYKFVYDIKRFTRYYQSLIEKTPLQLYCSALVFAPERSIVRRQFERYIPPWIQRKPKMRVHWDAALQTLNGHTGSVNSVAFSPDSKQVASGSNDNTVRLWDAATGALRQTLKGYIGPVYSVAFSPDGKQLVSGSADKTVQLWDAATGAPRQTLEGHTSWVYSVAFSPDGKQVVSGSADKTVRLWDAATGAPRQTLKSHTGWVCSVAFSPDGKQVVSGSDDKTVRLWNAATGAPQQTLEGHTSWVYSVAFSPDGKQVVSGSADKTVQLWDAATGAPRQTLKGHTGPVYSVAFSPSGKQVVSGSADNIVRLWDVATGAPRQTLEGHTSWVRSVAFSPDGKQVVSGSADKTVRLWDAATGALRQTLKGYTNPVCSVAFSPDGKPLRTLRASDDWIVKGISNIFWLPRDYLPTCQATWNGIIVLGHFSGRISFFEFSQETNLII
ncbi:beta transducin-like protein HET-E2C*40 [Tricladium varicosporioides]|nr:beta transducin-like protein HET-E2C*40 [Hymenoscyphus varicosporioides]